MIVDPDFFDHWKTLLLVESLGGDKCAPLYVLRLWAHCQNRKRAEFDNLSERALKAICRFEGHANKLLAALEDSGFVRRTGESSLEVCGWSEYNAKLLANWENGAKGGRPKKQDSANSETQPKPNGNPPETQRKPIRVDKSREDKKQQTTTPACEHLQNEKFAEAFRAFVASSINNHSWPCDEISQQAWLYELSGHTVDEATAMLWYSVRRGVKVPITNGDHRRELMTPAGVPASAGGRYNRPVRKSAKELFGDE